MPLTDWDARLELGHTKIDAQHMALADTINQLHAAMTEGLGPAQVGPILATLSEGIVDHFRLEEAFMDQHQYPDAAHHLLLHNDLLTQLEHLLEGYRKGTIELNPAMMRFLQNWFIRHIQTEDLRLVQFLRKLHE